MRGVIFGGRTAPGGERSRAYSLSVWMPVAFMIVVIVRESTEAFSGTHTSELFRPVWQSIFGYISDDRWEEINHLSRKTGHFLGYGTLGLTWLRAWLLTWMYPLRLKPAMEWRRWAFLMAVSCTAMIASMDELHQTFLPSRTGVVQDVILDTFGATILCGLIAGLFWFGSANREIIFASRK